MSHIMEKTLASIPKLLTQSLIGGGGGGGGGGGSGGGAGPKISQRQAPPMEVQTFMKNVHRARSKSHEAHIVNSELSIIKEKLKQSDLGSKPGVVRTCFTKALYCHLLGYNVHFIGFEAIKLTSRGHGFDKRLGYLMSCLILGPHSEVALLMISTIMKDIKSTDMMESCVALRVAGEMVVTSDIISLFLSEVVAKFSHQHDLVKEKAIHCFSNFYRNCPELLHSELGRLNVFLSSRDPGVLMAVMNIFVTVTSENPSHFIGLGPSFLHILDQINNRGFGSNYYYQMTPLPWLQISLLKVLASIGRVDPQLSTRLCPLLKNLIEKTKVSVPISLAVLVECIITATRIHPNEALLQLCSRCIAKLLASDSNEDMRYQGLGLLIALSGIKQSFVSQHQVAIVECLTNADHAIQSRTTLLLHAMANRANVKAICSKLFEQLENSTESSFKHDILSMVSDLTEKFPQNMDWYISTNLSVLSHELPQTIRDRVINSVLTKVKDVKGLQQLMDNSGIANVTEILFSVLERKNYSSAEFSLAIQLFGTLAPILQDDFPTEHFLTIVSECLCNFSDKDTMINNPNGKTMYTPDYFSDKSDSDSECDKIRIKLKLQCVMTMTKMVLCDSIDPSTVLQWLDTLNYKTTIQNSFVQNDLQELEDLARNPTDLKIKSSVFAINTSEMDLSLSFLDSLVVEDLLRGNDCYKPPHLRMTTVASLEEMQDSLSSSSLADRSCDNPCGMSESHTSQTKRKTSSKWRDDIVMEDDWNFTSFSGSSEKFVLIDSDDKSPDERNKMKAAEELFVGLDDSTFESEGSSGISMQRTNLPPTDSRRARTIWDDDDDDDDVVVGNDHSSKHHGIFNVGKIEISPFGISKKSKSSKPAKWTHHDFTTDQNACDDIDAITDVGIPVKPLGSLSLAGNNNDEGFPDSMYAPPSSERHHDGGTYLSPSSHAQSSLFADDGPWSQQQESLSVVPEMTAATSTMYAQDALPLIGSGSPHSHSSLPGSAVDALTDSDPETPDS